MDSVAGETVKFLLEKLFEIATEEYNLMRDFKKDSISLKKYLEKVNGVLEDAKRREIEDESVKSWLKDLEDAAYDADNILDEINYEYLRRQIESQDEIVKQKIKWYSNIPCCSAADNTTLSFKHEMAHKIKDINANFKRIYDEANIIGLSRVNDYPLAKRPVIEETTSLLADPVVIGRDHDEEVIREKILSSTCDDVLSVIPIVGMGGLGKTTLARNVFNHNDTQNHFNEKMWICVSEDFDQLTLFKKMLELLKEDVQGGNKEAIVQKLKEKLNGKRYLLVLDDLWNREQQLWDEFFYTLMGVNSIKGNAIIVTTRNIEVASIVNPFEDPYKLGKLLDDDCWSVIRAKAFRGGDVPMQFQSIGKDIARRCGGLPLLANMMGGVLTRKGIDVWQSILETELSNLQVGDKGAMQVIKVSYDRLPNASVKKCFAYCSLFIKDSVINKDDLIQLWMAEGFLGNDPRSDMESTGNNIFNMLLQNSFFQEAKEDIYGNIVNCKMHDLVHDLASSISKSENLICMEGPTVDDIPCVRRLVANSIGQDKHKDIKVKARHLRTLILESGVSNEILPFFKRLYVLKLCHADIEELLDSIGKLIHLRYLDASDNYGLKTLPDSICKLFNLQTLRILHNTLERLPKDLQFLIHLRHLIFDSVGANFEMPPKIGTLSCLETLTQFFVSDKKDCRIDELGGLKNLKGRLSIYNLELVCNKTEAENADIAGKRGIYELHLYWGNKERTNNARENRIINDESILGALQPHANLKRLTINGFRDEEFPMWIRNMEIYKKGDGNMGMMLDNLIEIQFNNCSGVKEISMLGHLPLLKFLRLEGLPQVTCIGLSFYGLSDDGQETRVSFRSLLRLTITEMENLTEWTEPRNNDGVQVLPCLEQFVLLRCQKLSHVPFLRAVRASLQELRISRCDELMELPSDLCSLESLKKLNVRDCNNLRLIRPRQNGQKAIASLQHLIISSCRNLTSLHELSGMGSLLYLEVIHCPSLTALPQLNEMGSLQHLRVTDCGNLIYLPEMSGMGCLQHLEVTNCMNLISPPELSRMGCIKSLRELVFDNSSQMQFNSFEACLDGIQHMKSLQELQLLGQDDWVYLPHQIQHLTSLKELMVFRFGIEAVPDWLGKLSSLQVLTLNFCEKLKHLPSKDAMLRLNKLTKLDIFACPLLKERCNEDSGPDSEWQKISHISKIER